MNDPIHVGILGATGRMGRLLLKACIAEPELQLVVAATRESSAQLGDDSGLLVGGEANGVFISASSAGLYDLCDVVIDFSLPDGLDVALDHFSGCALVTGTTGLSTATIKKLDEYASRAPVLSAANFSTGVNVLLALVAQAAKALPNAELEIVETHHHHKKDSPSGTALALGEAAAEARGVPLDEVAQMGRAGSMDHRDPGTITFHSLRIGSVIGEHTVWMGESEEVLQLSHSATSRNTFAVGALRAARWLVGKGPGRYTMSEMLGL